MMETKNTTRPVGSQRELSIPDSLVRHKRTAAILFVVITALGGVLGWVMDRPTFTSSATIHVSRNLLHTLRRDRELELPTAFDYESFRNAQASLVRRDSVIEEAIRRCREQGVAFEGEGPISLGLIDVVRANLEVRVVPNSFLIDLVFRDRSMEIPQPVLTNLMEAFLEAHRREYSLLGDSRPETLRAALEEVEMDITQKRFEILTLSKDLRIQNFTGLVRNPWQDSLDEAQLVAARSRRDADLKEAQVTHLQSVLQRAERGEERVSAALEGATMTPGLVERLTPLATHHGELALELAAMGLGHPARPAVEREMLALESRLQALFLVELRSAVAHGQATLHAQREAQMGVEKEVDVLETSHRKFLEGFQRGRVLENKLPDDLARRTRLKERLEFFEMEGSTPSSLRIVQQPTQVDPVGESKVVTNLILALLAAAFLAMAIPVFLDLRDYRIHTTRDVSQALGFAPTVWVPRPGQPGSLQLIEDQVRRLAQAVDRERLQAAAKIFVFTPVARTSSSTDLLESTARALCSMGRRVLVVFADHAPGPMLFSKQEGSGFLGLLTGGNFTPEAHDGGWDMLEYGRPCDEDRPAFDDWSVRLKEHIGEYDVVLVLGSPVLSSPDAEQLAVESDLVMLIVEAESQSIGEVRRAGEVLAGLNPTALGSVLNRARIFEGRGYYSELAKDRTPGGVA